MSVYNRRRSINTIYIPWSLFARDPLALSRGVSPSLFANEAKAPWEMRSSANCW